MPLAAAPDRVERGRSSDASRSVAGARPGGTGGGRLLLGATRAPSRRPASQVERDPAAEDEAAPAQEVAAATHAWQRKEGAEPRGAPAPVR